MEAVAGISACLDTLSETNLWSLTTGELATLVLAFETAMRRAVAMQVELTGKAETMAVAEHEGATSLPAWLKATADVAPGVTKARLALRRALIDFPVTAQAFRAGEISMPAAEAVCAAMTALPGGVSADLTRPVEQLLVDTAREEGARAVVRRAEEISHRFDPEQLEPAEAAQAERNRLRITLRHDGTVAIRGVFDREAGALAFAVLGPHAAPAPAEGGMPDSRDAESRYADAPVRVLRIASSASPSVRGERPHLMVSIGFDALVGALNGRLGPLNRSAARALPGAAPGALLDTGATICAGAARRLACDATIIPVVLGAKSEPLDIGRATRVIPKSLRRALVQRDQGCAMPGCERPPAWCDAHHALAWCLGGQTSLENTCLLCERHHGMVHRQRWRIEMRDARPWFVPPPWIDARQRPRLHSRYKVRSLGP